MRLNISNNKYKILYLNGKLSHIKHVEEMAVFNIIRILYKLIRKIFTEILVLVLIHLSQFSRVAPVGGM